MYEQITVSAFKCHCEKCGHEWISYRQTLPTHCARRGCSNPSKWNVPGLSRTYAVKDAYSGRELRASEDVVKDFDFGA